MEALNTVKILDIYITSDSKDKILEFIITRLKTKSLKTKIFTPNPEIVTYAQSHPSLKKILNTAEVSIPDGMGLVWAARMIGKRLQGRISGVDLMQELCMKCAKEGVSIGLLGGKDDVALKTAECLMKRYPGLEIGFVGEEWGEMENSVNSENSEKSENSQNSGRLVGRGNHMSSEGKTFRLTESSELSDPLGILFVAFGFPKQEEWIASHIDSLSVQAMMSVGGAFDFISGKVSRAPKWIQRIGFEWLYRLVRQPWRIKRQIKLVKFVWLVFKAKFSRPS